MGEAAVDPLAQSPYLLPDKKSQEIFERDIAPFWFAHGKPQQRPRMIVVMAQPGAGKTAITRLLREDFAAEGDAVSVEVDSLKRFHPELTALQREFDEVAADEYVQADARRWQEMALSHLMARRVNVIIEQFPRSRAMLDELVTQFANAGYDVRAALLTTPLAQSRQGVLLRYQHGHERGGGRDVPDDKQEDRFRQLPKIADWLQSDPRVAGIRLYQRDGRLVHDNARDPAGRWSAGSTREALVEERLRRWDVAESQEFLSGQADLANRMGPEWRSRIELARTAAQDLLHPSLRPQVQGPTPAGLQPPRDDQSRPPGEVESAPAAESSREPATIELPFGLSPRGHAQTADAVATLEESLRRLTAELYLLRGDLDGAIGAIPERAKEYRLWETGLQLIDTAYRAVESHASDLALSADWERIQGLGQNARALWRTARDYAAQYGSTFTDRWGPELRALGAEVAAALSGLSDRLANQLADLQENTTRRAVISLRSAAQSVLDALSPPDQAAMPPEWPLEHQEIISAFQQAESEIRRQFDQLRSETHLALNDIATAAPTASSTGWRADDELGSGVTAAVREARLPRLGRPGTPGPAGVDEPPTTRPGRSAGERRTGPVNSR